MASEASFVLDGDLKRFVEQQVDAGHYASATEMVRAGLLMLEEYETKRAALNAALVAGEDSGPPATFDFDAFVRQRRSTAHG